MIWEQYTTYQNMLRQKIQHIVFLNSGVFYFEIRALKLSLLYLGCLDSGLTLTECRPPSVYSASLQITSP